MKQRVCFLLFSFMIEADGSQKRLRVVVLVN